MHECSIQNFPADSTRGPAWATCSEIISLTTMQEKLQKCENVQLMLTTFQEFDSGFRKNVWNAET